jgi:hypothetical protein
MMPWNTRVVKQVTPEGTYFSIREVFYNEGGDDSTIYGYTTEPVEISGDNIEELREYLQWCLACLDKPVLVDGEVEFVKLKGSEDQIPGHPWIE